MAKINVRNGDWDAARAELKASFEAQNAQFNANLKAAFPASPPSTAPTAAEPQSPARPTPAGRNSSVLSRSRARA